jgi:hypothetical protein
MKIAILSESSHGTQESFTGSYANRKKLSKIILSSNLCLCGLASLIHSTVAIGRSSAAYV